MIERGAGWRRRQLGALAALLLCATGAAAANPLKATRMKIRITSNGAVVATATLDDNHSARDFAALLPLQLSLRDYAATEKIADLPRALTTAGAPAGHTPSAGDIGYYAPWGNLAIYHKDFAFSSGLVRLGRLDTGIDAMRRAGVQGVKVELAEP